MIELGCSDCCCFKERGREEEEEKKNKERSSKDKNPKRVLDLEMIDTKNLI